jgi:hypothetical protein
LVGLLVDIGVDAGRAFAEDGVGEVAVPVRRVGVDADVEVEGVF